MNRQVTSSVILMSFLFHIGCYSTVQLTNDELVGSKQGDISVATKASRGYHLTAYRVQNDTLYGTVAESYTTHWVSGDSITIPISEITYVEIRERGNPNPALVWAGISMLVLIGLAAGLSRYY